MTYPASSAPSASASRSGASASAMARAMRRAASSAASFGSGLASGVSGPSAACPSAFAALAARSASGCEADRAGSLTTIAGRTRGASRGTPAACRWIAVISAPDRVVGSAATLRGGSAAARALATSITRPPPSATRSSEPTAGLSSAASSSTRPAPTSWTLSAAAASCGAAAPARWVLSRAYPVPSSAGASASAPRPKRMSRSPSCQRKSVAGSPGDDVTPSPAHPGGRPGAGGRAG